MSHFLSDHSWLIQAALAEDIGRGDVTGDAIVAPQQIAHTKIVARQALTVAGVPMAAQTFYMLNDDFELTPHAEEGARVEAGAVLLEVKGNALAMLAAERTALNFLGRMCAVATITSQYVDAIAGTEAKILDTRKTLPGYRELDKYSVAMGGGTNHRARLDDGILIKDNHIAICGALAEAVARAKKDAPTMMKIEVECDTLEQVQEAVAAGADMLLLDNMNTEMLAQAVALVGGKIPLEASGNVTLETVRAIAETGVDFISVGRLTHSAPNVDIGLDMAVEA